MKIPHDFPKLSKYALRSQTRLSQYFQIQVWGEGGKKLQQSAQKNKAAGRIHMY